MNPFTVLVRPRSRMETVFYSATDVEKLSYWQSIEMQQHGRILLGFYQERLISTVESKSLSQFVLYTCHC